MRLLISLLLVAFVTLLLRSTALSALAARGLMLDALAFVTVVWALRHGESWGSTFGFLLGLAADLDAAHWLGRHALALALLGYVVGRLGHSVVRDSARTQFVLLLVATLVHQAWASLFEFGGLAAGPTLGLRVVVTALVSAPVGTLLLTLARQAVGRPLFGNATVHPGP
jgi:rod shape-determining protein MreD